MRSWRQRADSSTPFRPTAVLPPYLLMSAESALLQGGELFAPLQELGRILGHAQHPHREMQVGAGGPPGAADVPDRLAPPDDLSGLDQGLGQVGIAGGKALSVVDIDQVAVFRMVFRKDHHPGGSSVDRSASLGIEVDALVDRLAAREGIGAIAEA